MGAFPIDEDVLLRLHRVFGYFLLVGVKFY